MFNPRKRLLSNLLERVGGQDRVAQQVADQFDHGDEIFASRLNAHVDRLSISSDVDRAFQGGLPVLNLLARQARGSFIQQCR